MEDSVQEIDQEAMTDDFFSDEHPLVFQQTGEPAVAPTGQPDPNATPAENNQTDTNQPPAPAQQPIQQQQPVQPTSTEDPNAQTAETPAIADPFSFMDTAEDGTQSFNALSALDFLERKNGDGAQQSQPFKHEAPQVTPAAEKPPVDPNAPAELTHEQQVRMNLNRHGDYMQDALNANHTLEQAYAYAQQKTNEDINSYLHGKEMDDLRSEMDEKYNAGEAAKTHEQEMTEARPKSTANLHEVAKSGGYGTVEQFQQTLMNPAYGGIDAINFLFDMQNPGKQYGSTEELSTAMQDWFVKFTSDKQSLAFLESMVRANITNQRLPEIGQAFRNAKIKVDGENANGKGLHSPSIQQQPRTNLTTQPKDEWDEIIDSV